LGNDNIKVDPYIEVACPDDNEPSPNVPLVGPAVVPDDDSNIDEINQIRITDADVEEAKNQNVAEQQAEQQAEEDAERAEEEAERLQTECERVRKQLLAVMAL
jgi:hypothetical protein